MSASQHNYITRREALIRGLGGAAALLFAGRQSSRAQAPTAKAKSVIQIWMWGGPCHLDTFDPKPDAGYDYCGPLDTAIDTNVDGIRLNAALPLLAQQADKYSIIRSMTHGINAHETATYVVQTGRDAGSRVVYPSAGSVVSQLRGYDTGYEGQIPPHIALTTPQGRFSDCGFLAQKHKPFATGGDPSRTPFAVEGIVAEGISEQRQRDRQGLLGTVDSLGHAMPGDPLLSQLDTCAEHAYELILGEGGKVFDLTSETDETRDRYGRNKFGQSCLVARRLVEEGVPWITVNYEGWDTHKRHFQSMGQMLPQLDQGMSVLLQDLSERGLLESTIVAWGGEFGRTPKIQWEEPWNGGRSHFGACFSSVLAGGGFSGGQVVGASDATGSEVADRPVHPREMVRSIYRLMGIDTDAPLENPSGIDAQVLPLVEGEEGTGCIDEIM